MALRTSFMRIRQSLGGHGTHSDRGKAGGGLHIGMQVNTSDGGALGTITQLWLGADATDHATHEDTLGVRRPAPDDAGLLYIPSHAVARVSDSSVILSVDQAQVTARGWRFAPKWLSQDAAKNTAPETKA